MKAILQHELINDSYIKPQNAIVKNNIWKSFITYANGQEKNRLLWAAFGILGHGVFFTIVTLMVVIFTGNIFPLYVAAICNMAMVLVVNLAALPTKYSVVSFFISLLIDCGIIITAILLQ